MCPRGPAELPFVRWLRFFMATPLHPDLLASIETWREIPGYEGLYEISDAGRIRSMSRTVTDRRGVKRPLLGKVMTLNERPDVPSTCLLTRHGNRRTEKVADLVLKTFIKKRGEYQSVRHVDGNVHNAALRNLEWECDLVGSPVRTARSA